MRNEMLVFAGLLAALVVGYLLWHHHRSPLERATVDLDRAAELMRQDFEKAGGSMRVAAAEFYASRGQLPRSNAEIGSPEPGEFRGQTMRSASVQDNGDIEFEFDGNSGIDGGRVRFVADLTHASAMGLQYRCVTSDYPQIVRALPACKYEGH